MGAAWHAKADDRLQTRKLLLRGEEADVQALDFSQPAAFLRFFPPLVKVVDDLSQPALLRRVRLEHGASDACMFVLTWGAVRSSADSELDFASGEMLMEFVDLVVGRRSIFFIWTE